MYTKITTNNICSIIKENIDLIINNCNNLMKQSKNEKTDNFKFFEYCGEKFKIISRALNENESFENEFRNFAIIETYMMYIIGKNCEDYNFGHYDSIYFLLDNFMELFNSKIKYLKNMSNENHISYDQKHEKFYETIIDFRKYFNENIFIKNHEFDKYIDELNIALRDEK